MTERSRPALLRPAALRWLVVAAVLLLAVPLGLATFGGGSDLGTRAGAAVANLSLAADTVTAAQGAPAPDDGQADEPVTSDTDDTQPVSTDFAEEQVSAGILTDVPAVARAAAAPSAAAGSYSGRVVDSVTGDPLDGVCVELTEANGRYRADTSTGSDCTSADGTFSIPGVPDGLYAVDVRDPVGLHQAADDSVQIEGAAVEGVVFSLEPGGAVAGTLVGVDGAPLSGICVSISTDVDYHEGVGCTDDRGRFQTSGVTPGSSSLQVYDLGGRYLVATVEAVDVPLGSAVDIGTLTLQLGASVTGRITGPSGEPAPRLCLDIYSADGQDETCTDDDGRYTTIGLPSGTYTLSWHTEGAYLPPAGRSLNLSAPSSTVYDLRAELGSTLTGRITAADTGLPLAGICLLANAVSGSGGGVDCTEADGQYTIQGLPYGPDVQYRVQATTYGGPYLQTWYGGGTYSTAQGVAVPTVAPVTGIDLALVRGAVVSGRVTDSAGAPLSRVGVRIGTYTTYFSPVAYGYTAEDGTYTTGGLPSGSYVVQFVDGNRNHLDEYYADARTPAAAQQLAVTAGTDITGLDASLDDAYSISGTVTGVGGGDLGSVSVYARDPATGTVLATGYASTFSSGQYEIRGLAPGSYTVSFEPYSGSSDYAAQYYDGVTDASAATPVVIGAASRTGIDAVLAFGPSVRGTITDAAGTPVAGACAAIYRADSTSYPLRQVCAGSDGTYRLRGIPAGNYLVKFSSATGGFVDTWYGGGTSAADAGVVAVPAGTEVTGIDGRLVRGGTISGAVTAPDGGYVCVGAELIGNPGAAPTYTCQTVAAGGQFRYTTPALQAGDYRVRWTTANGTVQRWYPDARSATGATAVPVTAGAVSAGIDGALPALDVLTGRMTDAATGIGLVGPVSLRTTTNDPDTGFPTYGFAYSGSDGRWTARVEPGTYTLQFGAPGYQTQWWQDSTSLETATPVTTGSTTTSYDAALVGGGASVSGTLRDPAGAPLSGMCVQSGYSSVGQVCTGADGTYRTTISAGTYDLSFTGTPLVAVDPAGTRASTYIRLPGGSGGQLVVRNGDQLLGADATMTAGARLTVAVTADSGGAPVTNVCARLLDYPGPDSSFCSSNGSLASPALLPGTYRLQLTNTGGRYAAEYFDDVSALADATPVTLTSGATQALRAGLSLGGGLTGTLLLPDGSPAAGHCVAITPVSAGAGDSITACADSAGSWTSPGLRPGDYVVGSTAPGALPTWYPGTTDVDDAQPVTVTAGRTTPGVDITLQSSAATTTSTTATTSTSGTTTVPTTTEVTTTSEPPATTTSEAPVTTTGAPVTTTEAPVTTTTAAPVTTTQAPVTTTSEPPVTTSEPPVTTTSEPPVTTTSEAPVTTTEAPVTTTEAPVTTSEAPVTTTSEAPVTTTQAPVTTTQAPVTTTTQAPVMTTQAPVSTTTQAPVTSSEDAGPPSSLPVAQGPLVVDPGAAGDPAVVPGGSQTIELDGFAPDEWVHAILYSTPVDLGWHRADPAGKLVLTFTVPAGLELGAHHVELVSAGGKGVSVPFLVTEDGAVPAAGSSSAGSSTGGSSAVGAPGTTAALAGATSSGAPVTPAPAAGLAATGTEVLPLLGLGAVTLAAGAWLTVTTTRRRARRHG